MQRRIEVSIGEVKRDLSELVNRVAFGGEHVILTSRGRPKAALISMADLDRLQSEPNDMDAWLARCESLNHGIRVRSEGRSLDLDGVLESIREERDDQITGA